MKDMAHYFSIVAVTNHHKFGGLKQHRFLCVCWGIIVYNGCASFLYNEVNQLHVSFLALPLHPTHLGHHRVP